MPVIQQTSTNSGTYPAPSRRFFGEVNATEF